MSENAESLKDLRILRDENFLLKNLVKEVMQDHGDRTGGFYNECEFSRCNWCERAGAIVDPDARFVPPADTMWLVIVECRDEVVHVSPCGKGFFIPGQEPLWDFSHASKWVRQIYPED